LKQYDKITAKFNPKRIDDLVDGASEFIGLILIWQASWVIEDGQFEGEWAMAVIGNLRDIVPFAWVPLSDLEYIPPEVQ